MTAEGSNFFIEFLLRPLVRLKTFSDPHRKIVCLPSRLQYIIQHFLFVPSLTQRRMLMLRRRNRKRML
jgi:hypothetical protein